MFLPVNQGGTMNLDRLHGRARGVFVLFAGVVFFCFTALPATAGTMPAGTTKDLTEWSLEALMEIEVDTVYGAAKREQKVTEAPSSVSIITAADIRQYGYRTLADILKSVRGFYVTYDRNYHYVGTRGFSRPGDYNSRVLLLVDGHRINNNIYDTAAIGTEFILDVDLIDRVEVVRGPGSSIYGSNAFFGVINVITKKARAVKGMEVSAEAGSFDAYKGRATFGKQFRDDFGVLLSGSYYRSKGQNLYFKEYDAPATNNGRSDNADADRYGSVFANVQFRDLTFQGGYVSRTKGISTGAWNAVLGDDGTDTTDAQGYADLRYRKAFDGDHDLMLRFFYDYYRYDGSYMIDYPPATLNRDAAIGKLWGGEVLYNRKVFERHKLTAGLEYQDNFVQTQRNYDESPYASYLSEQRGSYVLGAHFQDEFTILDNLILNAGARYDHYKDFRGRINPRAGLIYNPLDGTTLKFLYGEAFRAPNTYELYYNDGNIAQQANPDLDPETIRTYEIVLEQYIRNFRFTVSGFYYDMKNLITQVTDPVSGLLVFRNAGDVTGKGFELELEGKWAKEVTGRVSYSFTETEDKETGTSLTNSPKHLVKLNTSFPLIRDKLSTGIEVQYTGPRKTLNGSDAGGFLVANLTFNSGKLFNDMVVSASVYNLFDQKYSDPVSKDIMQNAIEQDGRTFRLKFTYRF